MSNPLPKPKPGNKPKRITTKNKPGGASTPGAKADAQSTDKANART